MKRSEMVKKLVRFVFDSTDCKVVISEDDSSLLLRFIEREGILPPISSEVSSTIPNHALDALIEHTTDCFKWEPENE